MTNIVILLELHLESPKALSLPLCYFVLAKSMIYQTMVVQLLGYMLTMSYTSIKSEEDCLRLQQDLHMLEKWAATWKMFFNVNKCEFLRITNRISFVSNQ